MTWESRIIGHGEMDPHELIPNPKNWRTHPKLQEKALEGALEDIGWIQDVIVNERTGKLLDGHLRVELAKKRGEHKIPVVMVDLSEEEEELALLTLDPISAMADADKDRLADLLQTVTSDNEKVSELIEDIGYRYDVIKFNPMDEWKEMPEFVQDDAMGYKHITVHFETEADFKSFCAVIGQELTDKTKYTWFPKRENMNLKELRYENES